MNAVIDFNKASLAEIAKHIKTLSQTNAINCWDIAVSLQSAKEICETEGRKWSDYVEGEVGYSIRQANNYVQIADTIGNRGAQLAAKGCNFNTLKALSARALPQTDRKRLIDKMAKKKTIDEKYGVDIQDEVRAALPTPVPLKPTRHPKFQERLKQTMVTGAGALYLFDLPELYNPETARILVKHWKQKYHPDKGGDTEAFQTILEKEKELSL